MDSITDYLIWKEFDEKYLSSYWNLFFECKVLQIWEWDIIEISSETPGETCLSRDGVQSVKREISADVSVCSPFNLIALIQVILSVLLWFPCYYMEAATIMNKYINIQRNEKINNNNNNWNMLLSILLSINMLYFLCIYFGSFGILYYYMLS